MKDSPSILAEKAFKPLVSIREAIRNYDPLGGRGASATLAKQRAKAQKRQEAIEKEELKGKY